MREESGKKGKWRIFITDRQNTSRTGTLQLKAEVRNLLHQGKNQVNRSITGA